MGHVEWVRFARVERLPQPGEIIDALESWEEPAGGGGVAAVRLARLSGATIFFTAVGDDDEGRRARTELERLGVRVEAAVRDEPTRRAFTFLDRDGERTITTIGTRLGPRGSDPLPWHEVADVDAVYFTAGDRGALEAARTASVLVATARVLRHLDPSGTQLDALVRSAHDANERYEEGSIVPVPRFVVATAGKEGGTYRASDGRDGRFSAEPLPGPMADAYGAGDSFAAGLTFALGDGLPIDDALAFASQQGAEAMTRRGAHGERP